MIYLWGLDNFVKDKLAQDDSKVKGGNVDKEGWFFGDEFVAVENHRNDDDEHKETSEFGEKIIWVITIDITVHQAPEDGRSKGDFNMFPGTFVNSGEETNDFVVAANFVQKVG